MFPIFRVLQRHISRSAISLAKKKKDAPVCPSKKSKSEGPKVCKPKVEACKKINLPSDACKSKPGNGSGKAHGGPFIKLFTLLFCLPLIVALSINVLLCKEHAHPRPPFKKYTYMRLRTKPFPWGDGNHSLFHNPCYNALPDGYEDDECDEETLEKIKELSEDDDEE